MELLKENFLYLDAPDLNAVSREMTACVEDVDKITQEWEAVICASKEPAFPNPSGPSTHNEPAATLINLEPAPSQGRSSALGEKSLLEDDEDMPTKLDINFPLFQSIQIPTPAAKAGISKSISSTQPTLGSTTPEPLTPSPTPKPSPSPPPRSRPSSDISESSVKNPNVFTFPIVFGWWRPAQRVWSPQYSSVIQVAGLEVEWSYKLLNDCDDKVLFSVSPGEIARIHNEKAIVYMVHASKHTVNERIWRFQLANENDNAVFQEMLKESGGGLKWVSGVPR